jgi:hypothetical protein
MDPSADSHSDEDEDVDILPRLSAVYLAMFAATIAGQVVGVVLDMLLGLGSIGVPLGCSVVLEAAVGSRLGAAKSGGSLTPRQASRICFTYSGALLAVSVPLVVWMEIAHSANGAGRSWTLPRFGMAVALFAFATLARWALMVAVARRPGP